MSTAKASISPCAWIGLDVAKDTFVAAIDMPWTPGTEQTSIECVPAKSFSRTAEGARAAVAWAREQLRKAGQDAQEFALRAAMESTGGYSLELFFWLVETDPQLRPAILNPQQTANYIKSRSPRRKDDFTDARAIARFGTERCPAPADPPAGIRHELRDTLRVRASLVVERDAATNRLGALSEQAGKDLRRILKQHKSAIERAIEKCEELAEELLAGDQQLTADVEKLDEIFGVGKLTAMVIVAELGNLRRFVSARQLTCYCGLTPRIRESGKYKGKAKVSKFGNNHVRTALYMPAVVIATHNKTDLAAWYHKKIAGGMETMAARIGLMRKLLERMWHLLVRNLKYQRFPETETPTG